MIRGGLRVLAAALALASGGCATPEIAPRPLTSVAGVALPAPYPPCPAHDVHWGEKVEDPYRCLEDIANDKVKQYMRAQADATEAIFRKIPGRDRLLKRIQEIDAEIPGVVGGMSRDERGGLFFQKREAKDSQFKVYYRPALDGPDRLMVDPETNMKATGKPHAVGAYTVSRDGRLLSYAISGAGAEIGTLHVLDVASGKELTPPIDRNRSDAASFLDDNSGFFHARLAPDWEKRPRAERFMDVRIYLRKFAEPGKDVAVFGAGLHPEVKIERSAVAAVFAIPDQPLIAAFVYHGVDRNRSLYLSDRASVLAGMPKWRKVFDQSDQVASITVSSGWLYVRTAKDAPRYKVLRTRLPQADLSRAEVVIPAGNEVITAIGAAPEGLYVTRREGAAKKLFRLAHAAGSRPEPIALPFEGNVTLADVDSRIPGAVLTLSGWTRAAKPYLLGATDSAPRPLALVPAGRYDVLAGVTTREVKVRSHDGVEVPVSIISRTDIRLDGRNPTQLYGYAAYGIVEEPALNARNLAWLERGGVIVMCHARGGGIHGDEWHRAGWKKTKPNTWKDGIATAQWLVANGYTSSDRLAIYGGSAGAIFVGRAITERPELFSAAAIGVGNTDQLRSETRANGAGNIPEYGTFTIEEEFHALKAMSTYANIKQGVRYPSVLLEHGVNDSRVDVWMTLKTGTRLAAASASGKPVLMRLEYEGGHGVGATRQQAQSRTADRWSFFLWQAGVPEFQPRP